MLNRNIEALRDVESMMSYMEEDEKQAFLTEVISDAGLTGIVTEDDLEELLSNLIPAYETATGESPD
jgi:hypothetical protein